MWGLLVGGTLMTEASCAWAAGTARHVRAPVTRDKARTRGSEADPCQDFNTAAHSHHALREKKLLMESILKTGFKPDVIRFHRLPRASEEGEGPRAPGKALRHPERDHVAT
jgi:hypothetical protein